MTFEVDNTTQLLLKELQSGVEGSVSSVRTAQDEVKEILESMKETLLMTASSQQVSEFKDDVMGAESRDVQSISGALENVQGSLKLVEERLENVSDREMFDALKEQVEKYNQFISDFRGQLLKVNTDILRKHTVSSEEMLTVLSAISQAIKLEEKKLEEEMWAAQKTSDEIKAAVEACAVRKDIADAVQSLQKNIYVFTNKLQADYTSRVLTKLEEVTEKIEEYDSALSDFREKLAEDTGRLEKKTDDIFEIQENNSRILKSVSDYLSLPGYKRFFKGMKPTSDV